MCFSLLVLSCLFEIWGLTLSGIRWPKRKIPLKAKGQDLTTTHLKIETFLVKAGIQVPNLWELIAASYASKNTWAKPRNEPPQNCCSPSFRGLKNLNPSVRPPSTSSSLARWRSVQWHHPRTLAIDSWDNLHSAAGRLECPGSTGPATGTTADERRLAWRLSA